MVKGQALILWAAVMETSAAFILPNQSPEIEVFTILCHWNIMYDM
jgi:hypothetical protein